MIFQDHCFFIRIVVVVGPTDINVGLARSERRVHRVEEQLDFKIVGKVLALAVLASLVHHDLGERQIIVLHVSCVEPEVEHLVVLE